MAARAPAGAASAAASPSPSPFAKLVKGPSGLEKIVLRGARNCCAEVLSAVRNKPKLPVVVSRESLPVDYIVNGHDWISEISMRKIVKINGFIWYTSHVLSDSLPRCRHRLHHTEL